MRLPVRRAIHVASLIFCLAACGDPASLPSASAKAGFSPGPDLAEPRHLHASVLLDDGRVLVTGGFVGSGMAARQTTEIFVPEDDAWTAGPDMLSPRYAHQLVPLPSGDVLAVGGQTATTLLASAERFVPQNGAWEPESSMLIDRINFTATWCPIDGMVVAAGGLSSGDLNATMPSALASAELYFPALHAWNAGGETTPLAQPRTLHAAAFLPSTGRVLVAGGIDPKSVPLASAELFDPASRTWATTAPMAAPRSSGHTLTALPDGTAIVIGGTTAGGEIIASVEIYDPESGLWSEGPPMPEAEARASHTATLLARGGRLLVAGGVNADGGTLDSALILDIGAKTWTKFEGRLDAARQSHTAHLLPDGRVLLLGGTNGEAMGNTELFTPPCASTAECPEGDICAAERVCVRLASQSN